MTAAPGRRRDGGWSRKAGRRGGFQQVRRQREWRRSVPCSTERCGCGAGKVGQIRSTIPTGCQTRTRCEAVCRMPARPRLQSCPDGQAQHTGRLLPMLIDRRSQSRRAGFRREGHRTSSLPPRRASEFDSARAAVSKRIRKSLDEARLWVLGVIPWIATATRRIRRSSHRDVQPLLFMIISIGRSDMLTDMASVTAGLWRESAILARATFSKQG